jgi:hypothetical protein
MLLTNPFRDLRSWPWRTNLVALAVAIVVAAVLLYGLTVNVTVAP